MSAPALMLGNTMNMEFVGGGKSEKKNALFKALRFCREFQAARPIKGRFFLGEKIVRAEI